MNSACRRLLLVATVLLALSLIGCEGGTLLDGTITDRAGQPIASATIVLEVVGGHFSSANGQSNDQGAYHIQVLHYPEPTALVVTVSKEGFEPFKKQFVSKGTHQHMDVKLKRVGAPSVGTSQ